MAQLSNTSRIARDLGDRWQKQGSRRGRIFANTVSAWIRYREFLRIIEERYGEASQRFEAGVTRIFNLPMGAHQFAEADQREFRGILPVAIRTLPRRGGDIKQNEALDGYFVQRAGAG
jgi:hypothetical protein